MRRFALFLVLGTLPAIPVFAQRGGGGHGGGGMHGGGMAGGGMRGGFGGMRGGGFRGGSGGFRGGFGHPVFRGGFGFRGSRFFGFYSPFFYPAIYGGYWDPFFDYSDYGYPPNYGYASSGYPYAAYSSGAPAVIINQNSGGYPAPPPPEEAYAPPPPEPSVRAFPTPAPQKYETPLYLVAFRDGVIRAVLAYWVDGANLHYVSMDHEQKQAPLNTVDRDLSTRLNRERNVTFALP